MEQKFELPAELKEKLEQLQKKDAAKELSPEDLDGVAGGLWDGSGTPTEEQVLELLLLIYHSYNYPENMNYVFQYALLLNFRRSVVDHAAECATFEWNDKETIIRNMVYNQYHTQK